MPQSSSAAAPTSTPPASSRARSSPTSSTPAARRSARTAGRKLLRHLGVDEQRLRRVADPGPLHLRVVGDPPRHLEVGVGMDVDVAVAGRRVHHRHRRDVLQRRLQPLAAARDQQIDEPVLRRQLGQVLAPAAGQQQHRVLRQPRLGERLADDRRQRPVGALRVARPPQHDRVPALDRQRRAIDRHVRPRLVDDGDHPERHPNLPQVQPARQRPVLQLLADRVGERGNRPHPVGHRRDPLLGQRQPIPQRLGQPRGPLVGQVGRVRLEDLSGSAPPAAAPSPPAQRPWPRSKRSPALAPRAWRRRRSRPRWSS